MIAPFCFVLAVLASPFKSKLRLEAENAVLRHQWIFQRRRLHHRIRLTNNDRGFFIQLYRHPGQPTAPASPWQNRFAKRLIGAIWRECVDHVIVLGEIHLRRILKSYADYYNGVRTHRYLNKDVLASRPV